MPKLVVIQNSEDLKKIKKGGKMYYRGNGEEILPDIDYNLNSLVRSQIYEIKNDYVDIGKDVVFNLHHKGPSNSLTQKMSDQLLDGNWYLVEEENEHPNRYRPVK